MIFRKIMEIFVFSSVVIDKKKNIEKFDLITQNGNFFVINGSLSGSHLWVYIRKNVVL